MYFSSIWSKDKLTYRNSKRKKKKIEPISLWATPKMCVYVSLTVALQKVKIKTQEQVGNISQGKINTFINCCWKMGEGGGNVWQIKQKQKENNLLHCSLPVIWGSRCGRRQFETSTYYKVDLGASV